MGSVLRPGGELESRGGVEGGQMALGPGQCGVGSGVQGWAEGPEGQVPGVGLRSMGGLKGKAEGPEGWDRWEMWAVHPGL